MMFDPKTLLARIVVVCALAVAPPWPPTPKTPRAPEEAAAPQNAETRQSPAEMRAHLEGISEQIAQLTENIDIELTNEESATALYDEQNSLIGEVLAQISPEGDFGSQLQDIQAKAEENLAIVRNHPNPAMRAIAPRFEAQIEAAINIRTATRDERARGFAAMRVIEDEKEVMVMLIKANALDAAIDSAKQRLEQVRELADAAVALAAEVEALSGSVSD